MKKTFALMLCLAILAATLVGCASAPKALPSKEPAADAAPASSTAPETPSDAEPELEQPAEAESTAPYEFLQAPAGTTISFFDSVNQAANISYENSEYINSLAEKGGFTWDFHVVSSSAVTEQFNLLAAAGELPDVLNTTSYSGSNSQAVEEEIYRDIAPYIEEFAPDYYKAIQSDDHFRLPSYTEEGYMITMYQTVYELFPPNNGVILREDIVENDLGGKLPVTYDEYHDYLSILKTEYGMDSPLYMKIDGLACLSAGFDIALAAFTVDNNGKLVYGLIEDSGRELVKLTRDWYNDGLIFGDFYSSDANMLTEQNQIVADGRSGMFYTWCEFASYIEFDGNPSAKLGPGYMPRFDKTENVHLTAGVDSYTGNGWWFSGNCTDEKLQVLLNVLNYNFTEEGALLANYGTEGVTYYVREDGSKWFTDLILNNPDGLTVNEALMNYLGYTVPHIRDLTKWNIAMLTDYAEYVDIWKTADNQHAAPAYSMTTEEADISAAVKTDISTLVDENLVKFVLGEQNLDSDWDKFIDELYSIGLQDYLDVNTAAYERYLNK